MQCRRAYRSKQKCAAKLTANGKYVDYTDAETTGINAEFDNRMEATPEKKKAAAKQRRIGGGNLQNDG